MEQFPIMGQFPTAELPTWTKAQTIRLIELYRERRALWDPTHAEYKDRLKKKETWTELARILGIEREEVEKKLRMIVGQFQRELKRGRVGEGPDAPFRSKWIFFYPLLFLQDKNETRYKRDEPYEDQPSQGTLSNDNDDGYEGSSPSLFEETQQTNTVPYIPPLVKRFKTEDVMRNEEDYVIKQDGNGLMKRDEFDVFGEHVANTLRNLRSKSVLTDVKFQISSVMYEAEKRDNDARGNMPWST